ncbi:MAG: hypothetical protein ACYTFZ_02890 [Planctomycetota bacterium]|jgi:hypothetical protein
MASIDEVVMRSPSCRRAFLAMMWGLLFFLPLPILRVFPDIVGWVLLLVACRSVRRLHPASRRLMSLPLIGIALWLGRVAALQSEASAGESIRFALYVATWTVLALFIWRVCTVIGEMAERANTDSVRRNAKWERWLCLVALALLVVSIPMPPDLEVVVAALFLVFTACMISALMGLMASTARMCAHMRSEGPRPAPAPEPSFEDEGDAEE